MSVDTLSDSELRSKLMEYGYPVGPVTQTTRKILVKKLKNLMEARGGTGSRHSLAARYSSEDTDDDTSTTTIKKKKASTNTRRQTLANPMPPPSTVLTSSVTSISKNPVKEKITHSEFKDPIAPDYDGPSSFVNRTSIKNIQKKYVKIHKASSITDGLETGSDSDVVEETNRSYSPSKYLSSIGKSHDSRSYEHDISDQEQTPKPYDPKSRSIHTIKDNKYGNSLFDLNISPVQSTKEDICIKDNSTQKDILANYETPFLSEFTRRLSSRASINLPSTSLSNLKGSSSRHTSNVPELKEKDSNGHFSSLRSLYSSSPRHLTSSIDRPRETMSRTFKLSTTSREDMRNNQNMVSVILVVVLALFFGIIAVIYMGLGGKSETFPSLSMDSNIPLCFLGADLEAPGVNCVLKENVDSVLQLLKRLQQILTKKAVSMICDNSSETPYLTDSEIMQMFTNNKATSLEVKEDLQNAQLLVIKNPKWGISLVDISDDNGAPGEVLDSLDKLFSTRLNGKVGMVIVDPELPMQCLIKNKLFTIFSSLLIVSLGLLAAIGIQKLFVWYIKHKKSTEGEVFKLVSEIINMVEMHHQNAGVATPGGTQESFLAINHVRDNLILPRDRKKMAGLWEKAVKFLDENESRIRREVQQVAGEEFHVWRWLPNNSLNKSNTQNFVLNKKSKVWQGQAFETMEGSVNSLTCSPTPCLKIRHMFDVDVEFEDDWETKVQDAILEKCGEGVKILHIRVDRGSREGCVYMKCMSQEDAGEAYRALHGYWFDGHLVTVKYLRLERYHERFPDARRCTIPLKPSNNQRLSMQADY
ncbi:inner nuclear membrane protein Man1 [Hylaeus anthracinus]|uniref:inner nuclear membrane protein Man1 n=1 Tax=Hylaeus volcanicus TaxID=313075 RepID=UPI0023B879E9|nr:inner nuclear membrane protein Man1 [Hylaeus volcanicus]XP_054012475.1 inner nuclear membrane protein Man1 [Hylaeus anthracinus]